MSRQKYMEVLRDRGDDVVAKGDDLYWLGYKIKVVPGDSMVTFEMVDEGKQDVLPVECYVTRLEINDGQNVWELRGYSDASLDGPWVNIANNIRVYRLMEELAESALPGQIKDQGFAYLEGKLITHGPI